MSNTAAPASPYINASSSNRKLSTAHSSTTLNATPNIPSISRSPTITNVNGAHANGITNTNTNANGVSPRSMRPSNAKNPSLSSFASIHDWVDEMIAVEDDETDVAEIIQDIFAAVYEKVRRRELQQQLIPFVAEQAKMNILQLIKTLTPAYDKGENGACTGNEWETDIEPNPVPSDAHSRGVVPTSVRVINAPSTAPESTSTGPGRYRPYTRRISGSGPTRRMSVLSDKSLPEHPQRLSTPDLKTSLNPIPSSPPSDEEQEMEEQRIEPDTPQPKPKVDTEKKIAEAMRARAASIEREEEEKFNRMKNELRGKEYTYDIDGKIILINSVAPEKLPKNKLSVKFNVIDPNQTPEEEATPTQSKRVSSLRNRMRSAQTEDRKASKVLEKKDNENTSQLRLPSSPSSQLLTQAKGKGEAREAHFKEAAVLPMTTVEKMNPVSGVTVREGNLVKSGPKRQSDGHRMSKKEFEAMQSTTHERISTDQKSNSSVGTLPKVV